MKMHSEITYHYGSSLFDSWTETIGIPIDQLNYVLTQLIGLLLGYPFRTVFSAHKVGPNVRHGLQVAIGTSMAYFCFGKQIFYVLTQISVCYFLMRTMKPGLMEKMVFFVSMAFLCFGHIYRQIYDYGGYTLDITGPLMVNTQRLSSLAFSLRDGSIQDENKLSDNMKQHAVKKMPTLLEIMSYCFCFSTLMVGPFCFYKDYIAFIDGSNFKNALQVQTASVVNGVHEKNIKPELPSPMISLVKSLTTSMLSLVIYFKLLPLWPVSHLEESTYFSRAFHSKCFYVLMVTSLARWKYYFAWKLGQSVNMSSGLGFTGFDDRGNSEWELLATANIIDCEFSLSIKALLDNWNIPTTKWLRHVVYERVHSTPAVFMVSAFWHGFYPGYYLTFATAALFVVVSRHVRRNVRPLFQGTKQMGLLYDVLTFLTARAAIAYLSFPFVILDFWTSIFVYKSLHFSLHLLSAATLIVFLTIISKPKSKKSKE